jgi:hypothetical protein
VDTRGLKLEAKAAAALGTTAASGSRTVFSLSEDETMDLGRGLGRALKGGELLLLEGDLGYGKTVFARGVATALGILPDEVTSPSFTLVHEYKGGRVPLFHRPVPARDPRGRGRRANSEILTAGRRPRRWGPHSYDAGTTIDFMTWARVRGGSRSSPADGRRAATATQGPAPPRGSVSQFGASLVMMTSCA